MNDKEIQLENKTKDLEQYLKKIKSNPCMIEHDQNCRLDENSSKEESLNIFKKIFEEDLEEFIINLENLIEEEQK